MSDKHNIDWYGMSDRAILKEIAIFIKETRLKKNYTQSDLADKAGVHRVTLSEFENGQRGSLTTFIQLLRALDELETLEVFKIADSISPIQMAKLESQQRQRASTPRMVKGEQVNKTVNKTVNKKKK